MLSEERVRDKLENAESQAEYWRKKNHLVYANYYDTMAQAFKEVLEEAEPITGPRYNYTEWKD